MSERHSLSPLRLRTVFISDTHLGFKGCSAELLLDFLHHAEMDNLFLVRAGACASLVVGGRPGSVI